MLAPDTVPLGSGCHLTPDGARDLAMRIREYWAKQGYAVSTFIRSELIAGRETIPVVRSDMIGGWPREHPGARELRQ